MSNNSPDDLSGLFGPDPAGASQDVRFRQGVVQTWDPLNATNTVLIGSTVLTDLPVLNTSEALVLQAGDVVSVAVIGDMAGARTYGIWGRMTIPGTAGAATALRALRVYAKFDTNNGTTTTNGYTDLTGATVGPEVLVPIGNSGRVKITVSCQMEATYDPTVGAKVAMGFELSGANTLAAANDKAFVTFCVITGLAGQVQHYITRGSYVHYLDGLNTGDTLFTAKYSSGSSGTTANFSDRTIIVEPL